ncbi:MAG: glycosyltransferase family 39 protein [Janthinobacterium lividum]
MDLPSTPARTAPTGSHVLAATRRSPVRGPRVADRPRRRPDLLLGIAATVLAGFVFSFRLGVPSPWRDEAVTVAVASRSTEEIWRLVQHVDLVHAPFYFLAHLFFGSAVSVTEARSLSVVAAALTAPLLYGLTRRVALSGAGPRRARLAGAAAAALWISMPFVSRYAQEARPYAAAALLATLSTYVLVRASTASTTPSRRGWWIGYTVSIPLIVSFNTVAVLVLLAHAGWVLAATRGVAVRAGFAVLAGLLLALPLLVAQDAQREQVAFLLTPTLAELGEHFVLCLGSALGTVIAGVGAVLVVWRARARRLVVLGLLWGVVPIPLLWTLSQLRPLWTTRYLVFVAPGTCLLLAGIATVTLPLLPRLLFPRLLRAGQVRAGQVRAGQVRAGQVRVHWVPAALTVLLVSGMAVTGLHMQRVFRDPEIGHAENLRGTAQYLAANARPGDGLLFVPDGDYRYRILTQLYPQVFDQLSDIALAQPAASSATLVGVSLPADQLAGALAGVSRVWVVGGRGPVVTATATDRETVRLLTQGYVLAGERELGAFSVRLYLTRT